MNQSEVAHKQQGELYRYKATFVKSVDGDTADVVIQLGFNLSVQERIGLYGVNAPEMHGESLAAGQKAKDFAEAWLAYESLYLTSEVFRPFDSFGRVLATVYREGDPVSLNDALVAAGHAVPYFP